MLRQSTEYLLQKVSAQIKGDKIPSKYQSTNFNQETNDDLNDYLQSLGNNKKKLRNWNEDLSDISDLDSEVKPAEPILNRFLKKPANKKIETFVNEDSIDKKNIQETNKYLKKSTESAKISIDKTIQPVNLVSDLKTVESRYLKNKKPEDSTNFEENILNKKNKNSLKSNSKIDFNKIVLDDSDESIVNYLDINDLDDPDEIEPETPKKGILKSPSTSALKGSLIPSNDIGNNKSEIFGLVHNINDLISIDEISKFRNNEYESDFESTARSVQTSCQLSSRFEEHRSRILKQNSSVESTPRYSNKSPLRKVSISTKKAIFKPSNSKGDIVSRPITPATSRSYMSIEIEEASQLETTSSSNEMTKSYSNNSVILSTQLEVLHDSKVNKKFNKQSKEKKFSRRDSSKSTNYSDDFEKTFDKESASSVRSLATSSSSSSTMNKRKMKRKSKTEKNIKNNSCQTLNDLHQHWVFSSANMQAFSLPDSSYPANLMNINRIFISQESLKDLSIQNPAMDAFNDLMKQQLTMMRQYINIQAVLHSRLVQTFNNLTPYHYTTLEDTKKLINEKKPKVISYNEAYKQVIREAES